MLRRLIARRCIYGVDLNPLAVDLARLSIWIHSFVPGLPLSLLDHALVQGNALVGIATIGQVVLPRAPFITPGLEQLRRNIFEGSAALVVASLTNKGGWVFPEVHPQFTIALATLLRGQPGTSSIELKGPYASRTAWDSGIRKRAHPFSATTVLSWTTSASLPMLPSEESVLAFATMRAAPPLGLKSAGAWRIRPEQELNATSDRGLMVVAPRSTAGLWPVMKGESFDIWENDRGPDTYFAWAKPGTVTKHLQDKRLRSAKRRVDSAHSEFTLSHIRNPKTLGCHAARIAFRDVTRATDSRTMRAALLPPNVFVNHTAPHLLWPVGDDLDKAYLLGVLCSIVLDWYARRLVELHLTFLLLNNLPVPRPPRSDRHWQRAVALAGRLACPDDRFATWASAVGVKHGPLQPAERQAMIEELDAVVAHLYGLSPDQLTHIFDTFHEWTSDAEWAAWNARRDRTVAILRELA